MIEDKSDKNVFYVHGGVETDDRENIREIITEKSDNAIIVASYTFSTGI